jgi:hypothetical protein
MARQGEPPGRSDRRREPVAAAIVALLGESQADASRLAAGAAVEAVRARVEITPLPALIARGAVKVVSPAGVVLDLARAPHLALAGPWRYVALRACLIARLDPVEVDARPRAVARAAAGAAASLADRIEARAAPTVEARLERLIDGLARRYGTRVSGGVFVALPLRGRDAASLLGTTTESVSRVVAAWKRAGRIRATRDGVWIRG